MLPLLGPYPLGIATELPGTGVALAHGSSSLGARRLAAARRRRPRALAADRVDDLAERLEAVAADERVAVRQRGHHAAGPHARTRSAPTRGLTQTIRWARRARRSISRPTSVGSPRSQPSERITTTAPRAMPRRPWRSLNSFSASPIRVPLDQSGAAAAARWIARSGLREASARVRRVSRVANTNASAFGPLPAAQVRNCR